MPDSSEADKGLGLQLMKDFDILLVVEWVTFNRFGILYNPYIIPKVIN